MLKKIYLVVLSVIGLFAMSCGEEVDCTETPNFEVDQEQLDQEVAEIEAFLDSAGIEYQTAPFGIRYTVIESGTGNSPNFCSNTLIDYNGKVLGADESFGSGIDAQISLNNNSVVPGIKIAIANMNRGADYKVFIPSVLLNVRGVSQTLPPNLPIGENVEFRIRLTTY
jgi:FKBP-type peptidyl-prolyl cis-trans isomerase